VEPQGNSILEYLFSEKTKKGKEVHRIAQSKFGCKSQNIKTQKH
jgi:hypothetical protein